MELFDMIDARTKKAIEDYISDYALEDADRGRRAPLDYILRFWNKNKVQMSQMIGDQLIVSKDISFQKDHHMICNAIGDELFGYGTAYRQFVDNFNHWCNEHERIYDKEGSESWRGWTWDYNICKMRDLLDCNYLADNIYGGDTFTVTAANNEKIVIQHGSKTSKAIGKLCDKLGIEGYEPFRLRHSQILNEKTFSGKLSLSVHPLDYMTMSDNECDWCSCMNWRDGGEYRRGTVEMMNSGCIIEAYLSSETPMNVEGIEWSNKKWRELFIVTPDFIVGIKGYPYWNRDLEWITMTWIKELATKNLGWKYYNTQYTLDKDDTSAIEVVERDGDRIRFNFYSDAMYCDVYSQHSVFVGIGCPDSVNWNYSGESECMCCGSVAVEFDEEGCLTCNGCETRRYCAACGDRIYGDNYYEVDGEVYCEYCYDNFDTCDLCDEKIADTGNRVYLVPGYGNYCLTSYGTYVHETCLRRSHFAPLVKYFEQDWDAFYVLDITQITEDECQQLFDHSKKAILDKVSECKNDVDAGHKLWQMRKWDPDSADSLVA